MKALGVMGEAKLADEWSIMRLCRMRINRVWHALWTRWKKASSCVTPKSTTEAVEKAILKKSAVYIGLSRRVVKDKSAYSISRSISIKNEPAYNVVSLP